MGQTNDLIRVLSIGSAACSNVIAVGKCPDEINENEYLESAFDIGNEWLYRNVSDGKRVERKGRIIISGEAHSGANVATNIFTIGGQQFSKYCMRFTYMPSIANDIVVVEYLDPDRHPEWKQVQPFINGGFPWYIRIVIDMKNKEVASWQADYF
jgi:hypothetical protein